MTLTSPFSSKWNSKNNGLHSGNMKNKFQCKSYKKSFIRNCHIEFNYINESKTLPHQHCSDRMTDRLTKRQTDRLTDKTIDRSTTIYNNKYNNKYNDKKNDRQNDRRNDRHL